MEITNQQTLSDVVTAWQLEHMYEDKDAARVLHMKKPEFVLLRQGKRIPYESNLRDLGTALKLDFQTMKVLKCRQQARNKQETDSGFVGTVRLIKKGKAEEPAMTSEEYSMTENTQFTVKFTNDEIDIVCKSVDTLLMDMLSQEIKAINELDFDKKLEIMEKEKPLVALKIKLKAVIG